jgi:hypothetical protein
VAPERALSFFEIGVVPQAVPSHVATPTPIDMVASGPTLVSPIVTGPSAETTNGSIILDRIDSANVEAGGDESDVLALGDVLADGLVDATEGLRHRPLLPMAADPVHLDHEVAELALAGHSIAGLGGGFQRGRGIAVRDEAFTAGGPSAQGIEAR